MNANFPDVATLRSALALAIRAPSIHNSQPWIWRVGSRSLHLYVNPELALPHTDPDARDLMISCGASLDHCQVALAALGWQAQAHRLPDPSDPNHLATIELRRYAPSEVNVVLAAAILRRRTDRRSYGVHPVPQGVIAMMGARSARTGVMLRQLEDLTNLKRQIIDAEWRHNNDLDYLSELATWSGRYGSTAGVPARNAPPSDPEAAIPGRSFAGPMLENPEQAQPSADNATVIALGTIADDPVSQLRAGEATSQVLLTATVAGLASCPITGPLELADIRADVGMDVFGAEGYPQILVRIGRVAADAGCLPSTPRRPLVDVVTGLV